MNVTTHVSAARLREDIEANGRFGAVEGTAHGRTNRTGSDANRAARDRLVERMETAGLDVRVDAVGTIVGRWTPASADPDAAPVASGSHLDSVPEGGIFDGPLGVYAALEAVRAMQDAGVEPVRPVEVVSFTEEEGATFGHGLLGSTVACGELSVDDALALEARAGDHAGRTLGEVLDEMGYRGERLLDPSGWDTFLELHVEQHTELEDAGVPAGVVTAVTGIRHVEAVVTGEANHAGSTPMDARTDALAAASEFVLAVERAARERTAEDPNAVGTVGSLTVEPGATNVVPGRVTMGVDIRSVEGDSIEHITERASAELERLAEARGVETELGGSLDVAPTPMADRCREALHAGAETAGVGAMDLASGAAHDAMRVARVTDAGMLFAPSRDGISHNPAEWTDWADCADATRVLAAALVELAGR